MLRTLRQLRDARAKGLNGGQISGDLTNEAYPSSSNKYGRFPFFIIFSSNSSVTSIYLLENILLTAIITKATKNLRRRRKRKFWRSNQMKNQCVELFVKLNITLATTTFPKTNGCWKNCLKLRMVRSKLSYSLSRVNLGRQNKSDNYTSHQAGSTWR